MSQRYKALNLLAVSSRLGITTFSMANATETATSRALRLPEILEVIFEKIFEEEFYRDLESDFDYGCFDFYDYADSDQPYPLCRRPGILGAVVRFALVCRLWSESALPILGFFPYDELPWTSGTVLLEIFETMRPPRRQFYGKILNNVCVNIYKKDERDRWEAILGDVEFPNVKELTLWVKGECMPAFNAPNLQHICIDPYYEWSPPEDYVSPGEWPSILEQIAVRDFFPRHDTRVLLTENRKNTQLCLPFTSLIHVT